MRRTTFAALKYGVLPILLAAWTEIPLAQRSKSDPVPPSQFWLRTSHWQNGKEDIDFSVAEQMEKRQTPRGTQWLRLPLWTIVDGAKVDFPKATLPEIQDWPLSGLPNQNSPDAMSVRVDRILWALLQKTPRTQFPARDRLIPVGTVLISEKTTGQLDIHYSEPEGAIAVQLSGMARFDRKGELVDVSLSGKDVPLPNSSYTADFNLTQIRIGIPLRAAHSPTGGETRQPETPLH